MNWPHSACPMPLPSDTGRYLSLPFPCPNAHTHTPQWWAPPDGISVRVHVVVTLPCGFPCKRTLWWSPLLRDLHKSWLDPVFAYPWTYLNSRQRRRCWDPPCPPSIMEANKVLNQKPKTKNKQKTEQQKTENQTNKLKLEKKNL